MAPFSSYPLAHGRLADLRQDEFPTELSAWVEDTLSLAPGGTHFGFVHSGRADLSCRSGRFSLSAGMYFAVPGGMTVGGGAGVVIGRPGHHGFFHLGGPVEETGRLRYIDACTDSLLVPPVVRGDPCLNLLHLPPHTRQTRHTHPSLRVGLIVRGEGHCVTPAGRVPLSPGLAFVIRAHGPHSFHTDDSHLLVLAYHPDSDFGPTHEDHPMVNRTILPHS